MKIKNSSVYLLLISILFSAGLIFATLELPYLFDSWIQDAFKFPGFDQEASTLQMSKAELYFQHLHIKSIGYISLILIFSLVIAGFATNRLKLSILGTLALFIPVFGHFTVTMFFLAGLSFLRFLWIPFTEISPVIMQLGDILMLPANWIQSIGRTLHLDLQYATSVFFISAGVLLFVIGVNNWLNTRFNQGKVVSTWTYKISRHPQYLGWIIWTYGLYLLPVDAQKRVWSYHDSLPLLLTIMIIITISLFEEQKMIRKYGEEYKKFRSNTSFMFPLPGIIKKIIKHPLKIFYGTYEFDKKRKAVLFTVYYTVLLMFASYIHLSISNPAFTNKFTKNRHLKHMKELIIELKSADERRARDIAAMNLSNYGELAVEPLSEMIMECSPETNNFVVRTLGEIGDARSCEAIYKGYKNSRIELSFELIMAIGKLKCYLFESDLINELKQPDFELTSFTVWYLGQIKSTKAVSTLIELYPKNEKFNQMAFLEALGNIGDERATGIIASELKNEDSDIIEAAIIALATMKSPEAVLPLSELKDHENWEVRIYAEQAIKHIQK